MDSTTSSSSTPTTEPSLQRRSCDICSRKKIKCDRQLPACASCSRNGWVCQYTRPVLQPGPKKGYIQELEARVRDLEAELSLHKKSSISSLVDQEDDFQQKRSASVTALLDGMTPRNNVSALHSTRASVAATATSRPDFSRAFVNLAGPALSSSASTSLVNNKSNNGKSVSPRIPLTPHHSHLLQTGYSSSSSHLNNGTLQSIPSLLNLPPFASMDDANPPKDTHTNESNNNKKYTVSPTTLSQLLLLPRPDIQFVEMFFSYAYSFIPIFHPPSFLESYASQDPCLCYALAALGLRYRKAVESSESNPGHAEAQHFYRTAKALLESQYRAPTLSTIQALVVLSVYAAVTCEGMEYMILQGITARIFLLLKLDRFNPTDSSLPPIERELRKRVFWLCFIHDRFAVCLGGVGPQIPDGHGHVPLPCPEHLWAVPGFNTYLDGSPLDRSTAGPNGTTNDTGGGRNTSFFHYLTHLASIIGKVGSLVAMEEQTGIRYDAEHAVLELALGDWYRFLPSQVRDPGEQFSAHWTAVLPHWTTAFLHIAYQGTHILLNRSRMSDTLTLRHLGPLAACRFTQTSFMASRSIAAICRIISDRGNPLFLYICRFSLFCRMQAAFVFRDIIITRLDPLWANEARADVNELLRGFMTEARYSENAAQFARQLQAELGQTMVGAP